MKMDLLFDREPFEAVFNATVARYLNQRFGWEGVIIWDKWKTGEDYFLVNSKLNLIFSKQHKTSELHIIADEYSYNPNFVTRALQ